MKIIFFAITVAFICMVIKHQKPEFALVCQLCGVAVLIFSLLSSFEEMFESLKSLISASGIDSSFLELLLKALGFSVLTDISAGICRDSGNNTIANTVELSGKTMIIILALPLLKKLAEVAIGFIG